MRRWCVVYLRSNISFSLAGRNRIENTCFDHGGNNKLVLVGGLCWGSAAVGLLGWQKWFVIVCQ